MYGPGPLAVDYEATEIDAGLAGLVMGGGGRASAGADAPCTRCQPRKAAAGRCCRCMVRWLSRLRPTGASARAALRHLVAMSVPVSAVGAPNADEPMSEKVPPNEVVRGFDFAFSSAYAAAARPFGIAPSEDVGGGRPPLALRPIRALEAADDARQCRRSAHHR